MRSLLFLLLIATFATAAFRNPSSPTSRTTSSARAASSSSSAKSGWEFKGHIGLEPGSSETGANAGVSAIYHAGAKVSWRTDLTVHTTDVTETAFDAVTIPSNLLWHPFGPNAILSPYTGPGLTYQWTEASSLLGYNFLGGFDFLIKGKRFGIESRYTIPDITSPTARGAWEIALTGQWGLDF